MLSPIGFQKTVGAVLFQGQRRQFQAANDTVTIRFGVTPDDRDPDDFDEDDRRNFTDEELAEMEEQLGMTQDEIDRWNAGAAGATAAYYTAQAQAAGDAARELRNDRERNGG